MEVKLRNMPKTGEREYYVTLELAGTREESPVIRGRMGVVEFEDFMASFYVYCKHYYVQMFEMTGSIGYTEQGSRYSNWAQFTIALTELMDAEEGQVKIPLSQVCLGARIEFETFVVDIGYNMSGDSDDDYEAAKADEQEVESSSEEDDDDDIPNYLMAIGPLFLSP
ncbi:hypothetical protein FOL47_005094 [Perkinsus chesapeaki]|uniref:Uncharacterized protein n=1 Tax=Perkinsus chesapeaki TaxID=330153 RepID=A0A7J6LZ29_PERCH|nr:hypothetical protein FOL47_005094 [Perkinsus chesapeaki]